MLFIPKLLQQIDYINQSLDYKWTESMSERAVAREVGQEKLHSIIRQLNYKAAFGFGAAAGEWIFWRFEKWRPEISGGNMDVALQATEAHWYGLIDKYYICTWDNLTNYDDLPKVKDKVERPI